MVCLCGHVQPKGSMVTKCRVGEDWPTTLQQCYFALLTGTDEAAEAFAAARLLADMMVPINPADFGLRLLFR